MNSSRVMAAACGCILAPGGVQITARLSRKFYDTCGHDLADKLVGVNQVDATYRADLREFNGLDVGRLHTKREQMVVELGAEWEQRIAASEINPEQRIALSSNLHRLFTRSVSFLGTAVGQVRRGGPGGEKTLRIDAGKGQHLSGPGLPWVSATKERLQEKGVVRGA